MLRSSSSWQDASGLEQSEKGLAGGSRGLAMNAPSSLAWMLSEILQGCLWPLAPRLNHATVRRPAASPRVARVTFVPTPRSPASSVCVGLEKFERRSRVPKRCNATRQVSLLNLPKSMARILIAGCSLKKASNVLNNIRPSWSRSPRSRGTRLTWILWLVATLLSVSDHRTE